jgi:hypothetical protein
LRPPRGALRGDNRRISDDYLEKASAFDFSGKHLKGGMGASAPIFTIEDFSTGKFSQKEKM